MLKKGLVIFISLLTILCFSMQVSQKEELLLWSASRKLTWNDFKGNPESILDYKALTYVEIKSTPVRSNDESITYNISCFFIKNLSWSSDKKSIALLKHEQLHFDIAELATRKIREKYSNYKIQDITTARAELTSIFHMYIDKERDSVNFLYDKETNHGVIESEQKRWEKKIASELKAMNKYSATKVVVRRW